MLSIVRYSFLSQLLSLFSPFYVFALTDNITKAKNNMSRAMLVALA